MRERKRLFFLENAERQLAFPTLRSRSWILGDSPGHTDPCSAAGGGCWQEARGTAGWDGQAGKALQLYCWGGAREQEGRYTPFVKPCFDSAQPAFSDAQAWEPRMALFQNVLALGRTVTPSISCSTLAPFLRRQNAQDSFSF